MMQIELHWPKGARKPAQRWRELRREFDAAHDGGPLRLKTSYPTDARQRSGLLRRLRSCSGRSGAPRMDRR